MTSTTWNRNPTSAKIFVVVAAVLSVISLADFTFYGRHIEDFLAGVGFGLWAFGTYRNGNRKPPEATEDPDFSRPAYYASVAALVLVLASFAIRYWP